MFKFSKKSHFLYKTRKIVIFTASKLTRSQSIDRCQTESIIRKLRSFIFHFSIANCLWISVCFLSWKFPKIHNIYLFKLFHNFFNSIRFLKHFNTNQFRYFINQAKLFFLWNISLNFWKSLFWNFLSMKISKTILDTIVILKLRGFL